MRDALWCDVSGGRARGTTIPSPRSYLCATDRVGRVIETRLGSVRGSALLHAFPNDIAVADISDPVRGFFDVPVLAALAGVPTGRTHDRELDRF